MAIPISELQSINPSSVIELFTLELFNNLHGSNDVLRLHSGTKMNTNEAIVWRGNTYQKFPIEANGFEFTLHSYLVLFQELRNLNNGDPYHPISKIRG